MLVRLNGNQTLKVAHGCVESSFPLPPRREPNDKHFSYLLYFIYLIKMMAPWKGSNAEPRSGRGCLFFTMIFFIPCKSTQGQSVLSFLSMKKKPTPRGEEDGQMIPATRDSKMYFSIASCSGLERLQSLLDGNGAPGNRSIAQSYGQCGWRDIAQDLLNTSFKS